MAEKNPTGGRRAVLLDLPGPQVLWLRQTLTSCLVGVKGDLANPEAMPDPEKAEAEAAAYRRLLKGLKRGEIVLPDEPARLAVEAIATDTDRENDYQQVVAEHEALRGLLSCLSDSEGSGSC